jgi:predicted subunit of tRNA(5-methylaminomethyl-2-thiouridylate) methyltransferase
MKAGILFSGGKDSSLAALMLSRDYEVELNTFVFDGCRTVPELESVADALAFPLIKRVFEPDFLETVVDMMVSTGYPNDAINLVHRNAVRTLGGFYDVIGDGTRLNDRVPMLSLSEVQSLEARYECSYVRPLLGFGKTEVERLANRHFTVSYGETGTIHNGDYEHEIRAAFNARGIDPYTIFPNRHQQSLVTGRKNEVEVVN